MSPHDRRIVRADRAQRPRGPMILKFEPLEERQVLSTTSAATTAVADLVIQGVQTETYRDWGDSLHVQGSVLNQGAKAVDKDFKVDVYLSPTAKLGTSSVKLGTIDVTDPIAVGGTVALDQTFDLPSSAISGVGSDQAIYIGLVVDATNLVPESNETNNYDRGQGVDSSVVFITDRAPVQLTPAAFSVAEKTPNWGDQISINLRVQNQQAGDAPATRAIVVMTPAGVTPGTGGDVTIADDVEVPALGAYGSTDVTAKITLPPGPTTGAAQAGKYVLWVKTDADFVTNPINSAILLQKEGVDYQTVSLSAADGTTAPTHVGPDLATADVLTPGTPLTWGSPFQVAATVFNRGTTDSGPVRVRFLLGGPNGELSNALVLGDKQLDNLAAGSSETINQTLKLPSKLPFGVQLTAGTGRVIAVVDPENTNPEADETNNASISGVVSLQLPGSTSTTTGTTTTTTTTSTKTTTTTSSKPRLIFGGGSANSTNIKNTIAQAAQSSGTTTTNTLTPAQVAAIQSANAAARAQRAKVAAERKAQLQAMRQTLQARRLAESTAKAARGTNANSMNASLRVFPTS